MSSPTLPFLLSYPDAKTEKAYHRYLDGESQRKIAKALRIPPRTLARRCKEDGWEAERQSRRNAEQADSPVAAIAAALAAEGPVTHQTAAESGSGDGAPAATDGALSPRQQIEQMLGRQRSFAGRLFDALDTASLGLLAQLEGKSARAVLSQVMQLTMLGDKVLSMQRKAWGVPDKMEITGADGGPLEVSRVRSLTDDDLDSELSGAEGAATAALARKAAARRRE